MVRYFALPATLIFFVFSASAQSVVTIPTDYLSIQQALNAAMPGDTVLVQPGTYFEAISWPPTERLTLLSMEGAEYTIIDSQGQGSVLSFEPSEANIDTTTVVQGFSIVNGQSAGNGGGIFIKDASPLFVDIILAENKAVDGAGLYCDGNAHVTMRDAVIRNNTAIRDGGGIYVGENARGLFINTRFIDNQGERGADVFAPGTTRWRNNKPTGNELTDEVSQAEAEQQDISNSAEEDPSGVTVFVDPRIELMGVVQLLNDYLLTTSYEFIYKEEVRSYFSRFQGHPAVTMFAEMSKTDFNFDAVPNALLALSEPPALEHRASFSEYAINRAGGEDSLNQFVEALRDFAHESQFQTFFEAHAGTFRQVVDNTRIAVANAVDVLRRYSGMEVRGSAVILGMLLHHGGFAATINHESGDDEVYALIGPVGGQDGLPSFGSAAYIAGLTWHEFSHTFINPLTELHAEEVAKYAALYAPLAEQMERQAYPNWQIAVNEHIIRAITTRLAYLEEGTEAGDRALEQQKSIGFVYVEALAERLKAYEAARDSYPTIVDFYPQFIEVFREAFEERGN